MNRQLLGGLLAAILLTSCASAAYKRIDNFASIEKNDKAFIVLKLENTTKRGLLNGDPMTVRIYVQPGMDENARFFTIEQDKRVPIIIYDVKPGTYRLSNFTVTADGLLGDKVNYSFALEKEFYTYFTVRPGEVAYLGSYLLEGKDKPELTAGFDQAAVQDEVSAKNPLFEGYRWFSQADENRQSFF